ncbi:hypothetical protein ABZS88_01285 [Streptomyces sp. NPDC005480]|uniref:hypothetical protein n=1 Tax=Streptomyces sp. NPDC005480 TaxID=3154880 RepID=UPI0033B9E2C5
MPGLVPVGVGTGFVPPGIAGAAIAAVEPEHALRVAFASGPNTASQVAGCAALVAGCWSLRW